MNQSDSDDYSYSEDQDQVCRSPNINIPADFDAEVNETADSIKPTFNTETDEDYSEVANLFSEFYHEQLIKPEAAYRKNVESFINLKIFDSYRKSMKIYPPVPNLYFLPSTIILQRKADNLIPLRDAIVDKLGNKANVQTPKQRPQQILVTIHDQREMSFFVIRFNTTSLKYHRHKMPQLFDVDLSINPLFRFYMQYDEDHLKISETCGIFLYWAYQKKLLNTDFIPESALKLIVIFFYFSVGYGLPNIIATYIKKKGQQFKRLEKMYKVNKKLECELEPELFNNSNFSLKQKRSFYHEAQQKYTTMINILPVPYPVTPQQQQQFIKLTNIKCKLSYKDKQVYPVLIFLRMMQFLENNIKRSQRIIFDFVKDRKGISQIADIDFNIEIKHPIFGHNLCATLSNDPSKIRILKQQISNVVKIFNNCRGDRAVEGFSKIFEKS